MSGFFGGGGEQQQQQQQQPMPEAGQSEAFQMLGVQAEMLFMAELLTNVTQECYSKCIHPKYTDPALSLAEKVCSDRCVSKFIRAHQKVAEIMQEQQMAQMAAMQGQQ